VHQNPCNASRIALHPNPEENKKPVLAKVSKK